MHRTQRIRNVLERVGKNEGANFAGAERKVMNVFDAVYSDSRPHVAADVIFAGEERPQIGDCFLPWDLEGANFNNWLRTNQRLRAQL